MPISRRVLTPLVVGALALGLLVALPGATGTSWRAVDASLDTLTLTELSALTALWLGGLWAHSWALTASMPGLTRRRALTLNLSGSAVANVLPAGGAAGIGLNFAMVRSWGFGRAAFATYTAVSNVADVVAKLGVAVLGLGALAMAGRSAQLPGPSVQVLLATSAVALPLLGVLLASARATAVFGQGLDVVLEAATRAVGAPRRVSGVGLVRSLPALRSTTLGGLRRAWRQLCLAMLAYLTLQATLLWACLHVLGGALGATGVLAALAVDRLLTIVPLTPGGAGVVEVGTASALVALGAAPGTATAVVVLYRVFTFALEIPVGGTVAGLWLLNRRRRHGRPAVGT